MNPQAPTPDRPSRLRNPIIGDTRADTLHQAACVASFLARYQLDRADGLFLGETAGGFNPDPLNANETRGLSLLTETLAAALWFEVEGRQGHRGELS
ncbi:hypothetical protein [Zoogloea sp. 1C4]|uniref:hypothetical protein n=1 Tax=Zoogloea sp. 1C4 TaxID=2570190 RepID=UPI0012912FD2|nr:hypothetical protein [Zoogloea sp. 1C4]